MCGIHLIIDKTLKITGEPIYNMVQALHHRGPDARAITEILTPNGRVFMAQNRLRITDIRPQADKLFQSPDGRYTLAYNGEIYNYRELRQSLESTYSFQTCTDTEVLLYLLIQEGEKCLERLNGMFAFIWYDKQEEKTLLCRDQFGMKPLYYTENEKYLIVSSEIKGILASGLVRKTLNKEQIPHYLQFKFVNRPNTFFENIFEVLPGRCYVASPQELITDKEIFPTKNTYTSINHLRQEDILRQTEVILIEAVNRHIPTEVPAGLFLSGGVDSTLLLAICKELGLKHFPVFSIANTSNDSAFGTLDYQYAKMAAKQFGAEHQELVINSNIIEGFDDFVSRVDQPIGDSAAWLTFLLAQQAKPYVKVILSGAGADELFAGYNRHWAYYQYLRQYKWIVKLLPLLKKLGARLPSGSDHPFRKHVRLLHKLLTQISPSPERTFTNFTSHLYFWDKNVDHHLPDTHITKEAAEEYLRKALRHDQDQYLSADVLALTDQMTMQTSVEARLPYLDAELVTLAASLPASFLLRNGQKWILKEILTKKGGNLYAQRAKEGFGMPFGKWLSSQQGSYFTQLLTNKENEMYGVVPYKAIEQLLQAHVSGKRDYTSELWTATLLAAWIAKEFT